MKEMKSKRKVEMLFLLFGIAVISVYTIRQSQKMSPILVDTVYKYEKENDWNGRWRGVSIEVHYPQIQGGSGADCITNTALKNTAFSFFDGIEVHEGAIYIKELTYEEILRQFDIESEDPMAIDIVMIQYEVLWCTEDYVSVIFSAEAEDGARLYERQYVTTIDVTTGKYIHLADIVDMNQLTEIFADNHFEICVGTYFEVHEDDVRRTENIARYIKTFNNMFDKRADQSDWHPVKHTKVNQHYYSEGCENIGMDEEGLYIYFTDDMAFQGYFIFKIPWKYIETETDHAGNIQ
ncbi:MAG: hypothetical protein K2I96_10430 [Lachnospiraceae bacterium]|nr:hypothetical protein [Lachnospiraceae bacterium]